jgi:hypothetical protein
MGNSNQVSNRWRRILLAVVERLISQRWRQELFGNFLARTPGLSPRQRFIDAVDVVGFSVRSGARRALLKSPMFEPAVTGFMISIKALTSDRQLA